MKVFIMLEVLIYLFLCFIGIFILSIFLKDNSIIDIFRGLGFLFLTIFSIIKTGAVNIIEIVLLILIFMRSLRLSIYIFLKKLKKKTEDFRYYEFRKNRKNFYLRSFFQIYVLQFLIMLVVSIPIFIVIFFSNPENYNLTILFLGAFISILGFFYETIADYQLYNFIKNKSKGDIMTKGLYKYSRFPNYFGESVFWLGICTIGAQFSILSFISFLVITFLLVFISGVPLIEKRYQNNPKYQEYKKHTSTFIPLPPRKKY